MAITDHGNIIGSYKFYKECVKAGVKPIIGLEAYYTPHDARVRELDDMGKRYYHMILIAKNEQGIRNLRWLSTKSYTEGFYMKPRLDDRMITEHAKGLIATTACLGSRISQLILRGKNVEAEKILLHHRDLFEPGCFFIELQLHEGKEQQLVNKVLLDISTRHKIPIVLTNDCHYMHEHDKELHEQTLCLSTNAKMSDPPYDPERKAAGATGKTRFSFGDIDVHVAHHNWMWERAQRQQIPYEAISNTVHVANMVEDGSYFDDIRNRYPVYTSLPAGISSWEALERVAKKRLYDMMGGRVPDEYKSRMDHELRIIKKMGFYNYLLIVGEIMENARRLDVQSGPGRGSAGGSLVSYSLGIVHVDPVKHGLVFERWLNYGRAANPLIFNSAMKKIVKAT